MVIMEMSYDSDKSPMPSDSPTSGMTPPSKSDSFESVPLLSDDTDEHIYNGSERRGRTSSSFGRTGPGRRLRKMLSSEPVTGVKMKPNPSAIPSFTIRRYRSKSDQDTPSSESSHHLLGEYYRRVRLGDTISRSGGGGGGAAGPVPGGNNLGNDGPIVGGRKNGLPRGESVLDKATRKLLYDPTPPSALVGMAMDTPLTMTQFRTLLGIHPFSITVAPETPMLTGSSNSSSLPSIASVCMSYIKRPSWWMTGGRNRRPWSAYTADLESLGVGIYDKIVAEEKVNVRMHKVYNMLVYGGQIGQVAISGMLILLGSIPGDQQHLGLGLMGAANGVITGILSLIRGQGFPGRILQYSDNLRRVREEIEWLEKELRAGRRDVMYREVVRIRFMYELVRTDAFRAHPGLWTDEWVRGRGR